MRMYVDLSVIVPLCNQMDPIKKWGKQGMIFKKIFKKCWKTI